MLFANFKQIEFVKPFVCVQLRKKGWQKRIKHRDFIKWIEPTDKNKS